MDMDRTVTTVIDPERCIGCGFCLAVCPHDTIELQGDTAAVTGDSCLACGHCVAACPVQAVSVPVLDDENLAFVNIQADHRWLPHGEYDTVQLVRLMRSRRSCRNFTDVPIDHSLLEDLVKIGITAPSGSNCQSWTFTLMPNRQGVAQLGNRSAKFFKKTNRLAERRFLRWFLKTIGKNELEFYFRNYYESVKQGLIDWETTGRDLLFHGAAALIIVGSRPGASCPGEDALLATQNILLAAHSLGLGTCLIGFAVAVLNNDQQIKAFVGVPAEETIHAVIALGYPDETYEGLAGRKKALVRFYDPPENG